MTVREIYDYIDSIAPFASQAAWDNSGLIVGDFSATVKKAAVCLDVTERELAFAEKESVQLIISHHPVIFRPQKSFLCGNAAFDAAVKGISIISAHTNLDKAVGGVNDTLCSVLGLDFVKCGEAVCDGFLNIADTDRELTASELALYIKTVLGGAVSYCDSGRSITRVGICSGAGADFISEARSLGCDGFITGEATYHDFLDSSALGVSLFAAGHFETEAVVVNSLCEKLRKQFKDTEFVGFVPDSTVITEI